MSVARRSTLALLGASALAGFVPPALAEGKFVTIGIALPLTGASAEDATTILHGAVLAVEEANAKGGIGDYELRVLSLDNGTATAGQYRSRTGSDQCPQDGLRPHGGRCHRADVQR